MAAEVNHYELPETTKTALREGIGSFLQPLEGKIDDESLKNTPERVLKMYSELLRGYTQDPTELIRQALFNEQYDEMVIVRDIDFYSLCEHHLVPFFGKAHVGYLPHTKIVGLSKIPRVVDLFACRLQLQERLTLQIASALQQGLDARGVGVVIEARHLCTGMRGVRKPNAEMVTSSMLGSFRTDARTREEFLLNIRQRFGT